MRPSTARTARAVLLTCGLAACGGGGSDGGVTPPPPGGTTGGSTGGTGGGTGGGTAGGFTLALSPATLSISQSATTTATVTLARTGSFTGAVTLAATGLPNGVTAAFDPAQIAAGQTTSTLTLTASSTAAAGPATASVSGTATGATGSAATFALTVAPPAAVPGPFTMSLSASSYLALPATILPATPVLTIARNAGFTGPVAVSVSGLPVGLVVGVTPTNVTGSTASLVVLNGGAPNGSYDVTIRGAAAGGLGERTVTLRVVVAPPSTGSIKWQFCENGVRSPRYFFAVKDGGGPWTRVVPNGSTFAFDLSQPTAQVALVTNDSGGFRTTLYEGTAQEIAALAAAECALYPGVTTRTASGTFAGVGSDFVIASMGWWSGSSAGNGGYSLQNLPNGPLDLLAVRSTGTPLGGTIVFGPNRMILRRGINPAAGASVPPLDFASTEAFAPQLVTWTFGNTGAQAFSVTQQLITAAGTVGLFHAVPQTDAAVTTRTVYAVPAAQLVAGDLHQVIATVSTVAKPRATRQIIAYAHTLADRTIAFGPAMPAPTVTAITGAPAGRLRAQGTLPAEYAAGVSLDVTQTTTARFATVHATSGFLGGATSYDLQIPDLSAAVGWDTQFALRTGAAVDWWVSGGGPSLDLFDARYIFATTRARWTGARTGITAPADGAVYLMARATGTATP
ncbi:hypothetical protein J421_0564 [Gemmatirosa kalamazoonensis]|uniref:Uncharacterized protein n=1 Tax=Gemmatirosa kalamazoonensis TaxID=861299 RepID=W0RBC4_9BACT|nr:hypothetical protein [Gemmatirosa kalamazoonensis]AHG88101.1 hypothetical protein J421_0564 [Gemmatirosa kalamazoonensis]